MRRRMVARSWQGKGIYTPRLRELSSKGARVGGRHPSLARSPHAAYNRGVDATSPRRISMTTAATPKTSFTSENTQAILAKLQAANVEYARSYPGDSAERQA